MAGDEPSRQVDALLLAAGKGRRRDRVQPARYVQLQQQRPGPVARDVLLDAARQQHLGDDVKRRHPGHHAQKLADIAKGFEPHCQDASRIGGRDVGKRIGELGLYGHDAGVVPKGILSDEYGVRSEQSRWIIGGIDFPMDPVDFVPHPVPDGVEVEWADKDVDLGEMLEAGEIDALISADVPRCVLEGSPKVGRLFEDYDAVERDYYRRTGIFPIMHAVVVKRELAIEQPELVRAVYNGFCAAKEQMAEQYVKGMTFNNMTMMLPWLTKLIGDNRDLLGHDWWPYGIDANRAAIDAVLRYHHEQGLTDRRFTVEDVFVPCLLDT